MDLFIAKNPEEASTKAAEIIRDVILAKEDAVLGLATGSTPIATYKKLIEMNKNGEISFKKVKTVNLDEYIGLNPDHDQSYRYFMDDNLFNHIDIDKNNTHVPAGISDDFEKDTKDYEALIDSLGHQDVQVLGIGNNGHIAFNEPNDYLEMYTHTEELTESTIEANKRFFESADDVPRRAVSMGIGSIFKAKKIIILAFGRAKAEAVKALADNRLSTKVPATLLKLHPDVTLIVDEEAAEKIGK